MTARIFIGTGANGEDAESCLVLEHTLRKYSSIPLSITYMRLSRNRGSRFFSVPPEGWNAEKWATPFSGFRWGIPWFCGYQGKAIYMDSDFIVRADIAELWNQEFKPGKVVIAKGAGAAVRYCCSMWNCEAWSEIPELQSWDPVRLQLDPDSHQKLTRFFASHQELVQPFAGGDWNAVDINLPADLNVPSIKAIHYTRMEFQLHLKYAVPRLAALGRKHWYSGTVRPHDRPDLQAIFDSEYQDALVSKAVVDYVPPSLFGKYENPRLNGA